jgi:glycosyltransferase involved in cell wall biosynthesis
MARQDPPRARLILLGGPESQSGDTERQLRAFVAEHSLRSVELRGSVTNVGEFLQAADVYVHPSLVEGTSLAIIEAMSAGLPVAASAIPGNRDLLPSEEFGLSFEPHDEAALAARLERLLSDASLRRRLAAAALARAREVFGRDRFGEAFAAVYADAAAAPVT